ncbi:hypothetical protein DSM21852_26290 [Methylocystis bryophila]|nr:hypothetical protein DSM21852_26290 [Methylocystis bryophila]
MGRQNRHARDPIGSRHLEVKIEWTCARKRLVDHVQSICGGNHPDVPKRFDAIELGQQLTHDAISHRRAPVESPFRRERVPQ